MMFAMKKVLLFTVFLLPVSAMARFDDRHSLMPASPPPESSAEARPAPSEALLLPELRQWDASREGVVLRPLPAGKRYFTESVSTKTLAEPSASARAHVVSFNTKEAAELALAGVAAKYPNAYLFTREAVREQVGDRWVWRGYFVGDKAELGAFCRDISAAGEWCNVQ
jgi:hypothetical protein